MFASQEFQLLVLLPPPRSFSTSLMFLKPPTMIRDTRCAETQQQVPCVQFHAPDNCRHCCKTATSRIGAHCKNPRQRPSCVICVVDSLFCYPTWSYGRAEPCSWRIKRNIAFALPPRRSCTPEPVSYSMVSNSWIVVYSVDSYFHF